MGVESDRERNFAAVVFSVYGYDWAGEGIRKGYIWFKEKPNQLRIKDQLGQRHLTHIEEQWYIVVDVRWQLFNKKTY